MPAAGPVGTGSGATCTGDGAGRPATGAPARTPAGTGSQPCRRWAARRLAPATAGRPRGSPEQAGRRENSAQPGGSPERVGRRVGRREKSAQPGASPERVGRREKSAQPIKIALSTLRNAAKHGFRRVSTLVAPASDRLSRFSRRAPAPSRRGPAPVSPPKALPWNESPAACRAAAIQLPRLAGAVFRASVALGPGPAQRRRGRRAPPVGAGSCGSSSGPAGAQSRPAHPR